MNFHHLDAPQNAADGSWVVLATNDMFLVLTTGAELVYGPDHKPQKYNFSSELNAHFAAATYYNTNRRSYPYADRLVGLAGPLTRITFDEDDDVQSTPMDFK